MLASVPLSARFLASVVPICIALCSFAPRAYRPPHICGLSASPDGGRAGQLFTGIVTIENIFEKFSLIFRRIFVVDLARKLARGVVSSQLYFLSGYVMASP